MHTPLLLNQLFYGFWESKVKVGGVFAGGAWCCRCISVGLMDWGWFFVPYYFSFFSMELSSFQHRAIGQFQLLVVLFLFHCVFLLVCSNKPQTEANSNDKFCYFSNLVDFWKKVQFSKKSYSKIDNVLRKTFQCLHFTAGFTGSVEDCCTFPPQLWFIVSFSYYFTGLSKTSLF